MKKFKILNILLIAVFAFTSLSFAVFAQESELPTRKDQLFWIISAARGQGEFSYQYTLADGTSGWVIGKDGSVKVFVCIGDECIDTPDSPLFEQFIRYYHLLTQRAHNHNQATGGENDGPRHGYIDPSTFPAFVGQPVGETWSFENFPFITEKMLADTSERYNRNLPLEADVPEFTTDDSTEFMLFFYNEGREGLMRGVHFNGVFKAISNLRNSLPEDYCVDCEEFHTHDHDHDFDIHDPNANPGAGWEWCDDHEEWEYAGDGGHTHEHAHEHAHTHEHAHEHAHTHDHDHNCCCEEESDNPCEVCECTDHDCFEDGHTHDHDHAHEHDHDFDIHDPNANPGAGWEWCDDHEEWEYVGDSGHTHDHDHVSAHRYDFDVRDPNANPGAGWEWCDDHEEWELIGGGHSHSPSHSHAHDTNAHTDVKSGAAFGFAAILAAGAAFVSGKRRFFK